MDPFFGNLWERLPQRRPQRSPYSSHPYSDANVTPTKPEYDYCGAPKVKPKTFTVPVHGPPNHASPNSSSVTNGTSSSKKNPKKVVTIPIDSESPKSSSGINKAAAPRMDEASAATKIQSAFRGFSARKGSPLKNLRVIRDVKAKAEDIRRRLADRQVVESILQTEKERLRINEEIMSLLLKLDAIQGVNSFVRESRKAVIRELVNLQEMVDFIFTGKSIEGTGSMVAGAAEENKHGEEMVASAEENGDVQSLERSSNEEEMAASGQENGDEQSLERSPNEEEIRDEELLERDSKENKLEEQELKPKVDVVRHSMDEEKCAESDSDFEVQTCRRLNDLDLSQADAETIQADEQHIEDGVMECEENGEVIEAGARENGNVEEDILKVKDENERLKKTMVDLYKKTELQNKLINNLSLRIAQLEEQISKSKKKKCGDKKKKTKETSNDTTRRQNTE